MFVLLVVAQREDAAAESGDPSRNGASITSGFALR
jgi:hypothetical protein